MEADSANLAFKNKQHYLLIIESLIELEMDLACKHLIKQYLDILNTRFLLLLGASLICVRVSPKISNFFQ